MARKSKAGRKPRHSGEVLRKNRTFRIRGRLDQLLEKSAAENGRSTSEEIEHRLETSFHDERVALAHTRQRCGCSTFANVRLRPWCSKESPQIGPEIVTGRRISAPP